MHGELRRRCLGETHRCPSVRAHAPPPYLIVAISPAFRCWISLYQIHTEIPKYLEKAGKAVSREWEFCQRSRTLLCEERLTSSRERFHLRQKLFVFYERVLIDILKKMFWETALLFQDRKGQPCCHHCRFLPRGISLLAHLWTELSPPPFLRHPQRP